ncbi:predicted protein [Nematostella vectensis]|uniref:vitamin-K-epoxide reductase (warfarin-sensitive) n=1 Tax=Nematostella vectensis TaxID=45351 RepID=A7SL97_NEMVE|nr:vitamin K epoxide reductase complex subunit 1 [Nematostella vectensis]EDO35534.1 predicted protein [Nematostella vectensis]|eukprot:XP_001627634.1 predicted protein [Nematostella vectensis]
MDKLGGFRMMLCVAGVFLSAYALNVEVSKSNNKDYRAICDISEKISCSKVFSSKYGTGFGLVEPIFGKDSTLNVPNSIFGIMFYTMVFLLGFSRSKLAAQLSVFSAVLSCLGSVYLGCILYFVLQDVCIICISTYVVNACLLVVNSLSLVNLQERTKRKQK